MKNVRRLNVMFEAFTAPARGAIKRAQREAGALGHGAVEVEHLLLGLLGCEDEIVSQVWRECGLTIGPVRETVRHRLVSGDPGAASVRRLPFSQAAKDALRSAYRFGPGEPGPEHLLIVLTRRGEVGASGLLAAVGVDSNQVRYDTKQRAGRHGEPGTGVTGGVSRLLEELDFGDL